MELVLCRNCIGGEVWIACPACDKGQINGGECIRCKGIGELATPCEECGATGQVTVPYAKLRTMFNPAGNLVKFPGVHYQRHFGLTDDALRSYWELRDELRQPGVVVKGWTNWEEEQIVTVAQGGFQLLCSGLSWGYRGTGAQGLAVVLADLEKFQSFEAAVEWVARNEERAWEL